MARTTIEAAGIAFVDAMNSGFWLSAAIMLSGAVVAATLLPKRARVAQVQRTVEVRVPEDPFRPSDEPAPAGV